MPLNTSGGIIVYHSCQSPPSYLYTPPVDVAVTVTPLSPFANENSCVAWLNVGIVILFVTYQSVPSLVSVIPKSVIVAVSPAISVIVGAVPPLMNGFVPWFAKSNNGVTATVTSTGGVYKYEGDDWKIWYTIIPPLVFRGMTFEQTDFWQIPEMVFRGFSFEITDKVSGASMFHGMG